METYHALARFAQTFGMLYFVGIFLIVLVYALAPSRRRTFDDAAQIPFRED